jgi:hypothetical protein
MNDALALQAYWSNVRYGDDFTTPPTPDGDPTTQWGLYGAKADYSDDALSFAVEYARNYDGQDLFQHNDGWMVKADAAMNFAFEKADLTPRVSYVHSEQNFYAEGNFAPTIIYNGLRGVSVNTLSANIPPENLRMINAGVDFAFGALDRFAFAFDYYAISDGQTDNPSWVGNEFDLWAKYAVNDYVELHAGLAYMTNTDYEDDPYAGQLGMIVKF